MKKHIFLASFLLSSSIPLFYSDLAQKLSGYILLQVEKNGEAWYVRPQDKKRYYLSRPKDAFLIMQKFGIGITDTDLKKIPIGLLPARQDSDNDGLDDNLENAIGTNPHLKDTDNDGYSDKEEVENNFNPNGNEKINIDMNFTEKNLGKIFLQTEKNGEAWYVNPQNKKRYFLARPIDAWNIMRNLGLGVSEQNIKNIQIANLKPCDKEKNTKPQTINTPANTATSTNNSVKQNPFQQESPQSVINKVSTAIRAETNPSQYFTKNLKKAVEYSMKFASKESKFMLANFFSGCSLESQNDNEAIFKNEVYWQGSKYPIKIHLSKKNGTWLISQI